MRSKMTKYSKRAMRMKVMLVRIHPMRGQMLLDLGMLLLALLFRLIVMRRRVRRRPSLPGTASTLTAKLTQLTITIKPQGTK